MRMEQRKKMANVVFFVSFFVFEVRPSTWAPAPRIQFFSGSQAVILTAMSLQLSVLIVVSLSLAIPFSQLIFLSCFRHFYSWWKVRGRIWPGCLCAINIFFFAFTRFVHSSGVALGLLLFICSAISVVREINFLLLILALIFIDRFENGCADIFQRCSWKCIRLLANNVCVCVFDRLFDAGIIVVVVIAWNVLTAQLNKFLACCKRARARARWWYFPFSLSHQIINFYYRLLW